MPIVGKSRRVVASIELRSTKYRVWSTHIPLCLATLSHRKYLQGKFGSLPSGVPKSGRALGIGFRLQIRARIV